LEELKAKILAEVQAKIKELIEAEIAEHGTAPR
jgi:hypothetical protein